ncbi:MAG: TetR family transcriptional regulator [Kiritimatiellia bacterium]
MARRTKAEAAKTRQKILKAARDLFSKKGYDRTTFEDIAHRINLTKGAVYWHFRSKPELLRQLVVYSIDQATGDQRIIDFQPGSFEELKNGLKEWMARIVTVPQNRQHVKMLLALDWSRPALQGVRAQFKTLDNSVINVTRTALQRMQQCGEIRADVDAHNVAYAIGLSWIGILHCQLSAGGKDYDVNTVIDFLMESVGERILA